METKVDFSRNSHLHLTPSPPSHSTPRTRNRNQTSNLHLQLFVYLRPNPLPILSPTPRNTLRPRARYPPAPPRTRPTSSPTPRRAAKRRPPRRRFLPSVHRKPANEARHPRLRRRRRAGVRLFHTRRCPVKPQLGSLIAVSAYFDVDIVELLTNPESAASQATLGFSRALPSRRRRPSSLRREERSEWFDSELRKALEVGPPYPSVPEFCKLRDFSPRGAWYKHGLLFDLSKKHREWMQSEREKAKRRAISAIRRLTHLRSSMTTKQFERLISERASTPIHVVRSILR